MLGGIPQQQLALRIGGEPGSPECQMLIGFGFALHGPKPSPEWDWPPEWGLGVRNHSLPVV